MNGPDDARDLDRWPPDLGDDLPVPGEDDPVALAATDALLDALGGRRAEVLDLDDPAVVALLTLAADADRDPAPPAADGGLSVVVREVRPVRPPRALRVRALAVAASAAVALYGGLAAASGSWTPWTGGETVQVQAEDARQLRVLLTAGLSAVRDDDLVGAQQRLREASALLRDADLTPADEAQVEQLIARLAQQLTARGVTLTPGLLPPGVALPSVTTSATPSTGDGTPAGSDPASAPESDPASDPETDGADPGRGGGRPSDAGRPTDPGPSGTTADPGPTSADPTTEPGTNPGGQTGKPSKTSKPPKSPKPTKTSKSPKPAGASAGRP